MTIDCSDELFNSLSIFAEITSANTGFAANIKNGVWFFTNNANNHIIFEAKPSYGAAEGKVDKIRKNQTVVS